MSIETRVVTLSRSFRSLIKRQRGEPLHIKDLKDLRVLCGAAAIDIKVLQTLGMARDRPSPYGERGRFFSCYRSAGACPPRSLDLCGKRPQPRDHGCLRLRPVHGEGQALALRKGAAFFIVARGPRMPSAQASGFPSPSFALRKKRL